MTVGCCGCRDRPGPDDEGGGSAQQQSVGEAISSALYGRLGRVERYRHADTIVFLSCALLTCYALVLLVQHSSQPDTCTVATPMNRLPRQVQLLLRNKEATWRCTKGGAGEAGVAGVGGGDGYDLVMSLELGQFMFGTSNSSVTQIVPKGCSVQTNKPETDASVPTSCPDWPQCHNIEEYLWDKNCQLELPPVLHRSSSRDVWGWYFSLTSLVLAGLLLFIFILKLTICCCGGKREGVAVIV